MISAQVAVRQTGVSGACPEAFVLADAGIQTLHPVVLDPSCGTVVYDYVRVHNDLLTQELVRMGESCKSIRAVFVAANEDLVSIYSVVESYSERVVEDVMALENSLTDRFPNRAFDFRIRAARGRPVASVVPINADPVYLE